MLLTVFIRITENDVSKLIAKSKRPQAERATEHAMVELFHCVATRRALRTKFAKVDMFACDVMGVRADGTRVFVQTTSGQTAAVLTRRRKLEAYPWHHSDYVAVWQLTERASVSNPRRKDWFFRVWEYTPGWQDGKREWAVQDDPIPVKREWFKARH